MANLSDHPRQKLLFWSFISPCCMFGSLNSRINKFYKYPCCLAYFQIVVLVFVVFSYLVVLFIELIQLSTSTNVNNKNQKTFLKIKIPFFVLILALLVILKGIFMYFTRIRIRKILGIKLNKSEDIVYSIFCDRFALVQMYSEVLFRDRDLEFSIV